MARPEWTGGVGAWLGGGWRRSGAGRRARSGGPAQQDKYVFRKIRHKNVRFRLRFLSSEVVDCHSSPLFFWTRIYLTTAGPERRARRPAERSRHPPPSQAETPEVHGGLGQQVQTWTTGPRTMPELGQWGQKYMIPTCLAGGRSPVRRPVPDPLASSPAKWPDFLAIRPQNWPFGSRTGHSAPEPVLGPNGQFWDQLASSGANWSELPIGQTVF